jgi:hypothetical protein
MLSILMIEYYVSQILSSKLFSVIVFSSQNRLKSQVGLAIGHAAAAASGSVVQTAESGSVVQSTVGDAAASKSV